MLVFTATKWSHEGTNHSSNLCNDYDRLEFGKKLDRHKKPGLSTKINSDFLSLSLCSPPLLHVPGTGDKWNHRLGLGTRLVMHFHEDFCILFQTCVCMCLHHVHISTHSQSCSARNVNSWWGSWEGSRPHQSPSNPFPFGCSWRLIRFCTDPKATAVRPLAEVLKIALLYSFHQWHQLLPSPGSWLTWSMFHAFIVPCQDREEERGSCLIYQ